MMILCSVRVLILKSGYFQKRSVCHSKGDVELFYHRGFISYPPECHVKSEKIYILIRFTIYEVNIQYVNLKRTLLLKVKMYYHHATRDGFFGIHNDCLANSFVSRLHSNPLWVWSLQIRSHTWSILQTWCPHNGLFSGRLVN